MAFVVFGKELIILNEELVIYLSFLTVLSILVSNFGGQLADQFKERANAIAQSYSDGAQKTYQEFLKKLLAVSKNANAIKELTSYELVILLKLLLLKQVVTKAIATSFKKIQ